MPSILSGRVIRGDGYGKKIGFPTANIDRRQWSRSRVKPKLGIYAGIVVLSNKKKHKAGLVVGPLDNKGLPKLEAYLLNFKGNLYGEKLVFELVKFLHPFKKYRTEEQLIAGIARDIKRVETIIEF